MVDEDSHSTDLSVSIEEGYSTILLAHYFFLVWIKDKVIKQRWLRRKISQKCLEILLLSYKFHILASDPKTFLFFRATSEKLSLQKQLLIFFWETFWKIMGNFLENLEQLVESPSPYNLHYVLFSGIGALLCHNPYCFPSQSLTLIWIGAGRLKIRA